MVITNQGVVIQLGFSSKTICSFENRPIGCVYKTGTKYASKDEIELAVRKVFREVLIEVLSFGFGVAVLVLAHLLALQLVDGFSLVHTVIYGAHKQAHNKEKEIKVLSLSSNQKKLRYGGRNNIFGRFPNGTARIVLEMAWSDVEIIGGFLHHEMLC